MKTVIHREKITCDNQKCKKSYVFNGSRIGEIENLNWIHISIKDSVFLQQDTQYDFCSENCLLEWLQQRKIEKPSDKKPFTPCGEIVLEEFKENKEFLAEVEGSCYSPEIKKMPRYFPSIPDGNPMVKGPNADTFQG